MGEVGGGRTDDREEKRDPASEGRKRDPVMMGPGQPGPDVLALLPEGLCVAFEGETVRGIPCLSRIAPMAPPMTSLVEPGGSVTFSSCPSVCEGDFHGFFRGSPEAADADGPTSFLTEGSAPEGAGTLSPELRIRTSPPMPVWPGYG